MKTTIVLAFALAAFGSAQTAQQIDAGRASYQTRCARCHGADLGGGEAPQLAGQQFPSLLGNPQRQ